MNHDLDEAPSACSSDATAEKNKISPEENEISLDMNVGCGVGCTPILIALLLAALLMKAYHG